MKLHQLQDTAKRIPLYLTDAAGAAVTGLGSAVTVTLDKNGGGFGAATGTVAESANGLYWYTPSVADVSTLGPLIVRATGTGVSPQPYEYRVVAFNPYLDTNLGLSDLVAVKAKTDTLPTSFPANFASMVISVGGAVTVGTNSDKTGYKLASDGLDSIAVTAPTGVASTFPGMVVQTWRRFFAKATKTSTQIKTYANDGTTVVTTQTVSDDGSVQTQGAAS